MNLFDSLIKYDKQLLLFLHLKGSETFDNFWLSITNPLCWIPLFIILFFLGYNSFGLKKSIQISLLTILASGIALGIVNSIKNTVQRIRPINDESINDKIRILIEPNDFSFVSGHSTISFVIAFISFWVLRKHYKFSVLIFLFPLLFAYSRIYLAVHFPIDILMGMFLGFIIGFCFYKLILVLVLKK